MSRFRRVLVPLTATWLVLHVLVVTGTAVAVLSSVNATSNIACTCAHGAEHGGCPMHRTSADSSRCRLQSTQDDFGMALMSLLAPMTLPATATAANVDASSPGPIGYAWPLSSNWTVPPDAPPPRS